MLHHYKGAQSALSLINRFPAFPQDIYMLRAGYAGVVDPLTSIGKYGFGATGFHTLADYLAWDSLSGDRGMNIASNTLSTIAIAVNDGSLGGQSVFGAKVTQKGDVVTVVPNDPARSRVFSAENALHLHRMLESLRR